jgi:hypothetical protein
LTGVKAIEMIISTTLTGVKAIEMIISTTLTGVKAIEMIISATLTGVKATEMIISTTLTPVEMMEIIISAANTMMVASKIMVSTAKNMLMVSPAMARRKTADAPGRGHSIHARRNWCIKLRLSAAGFFLELAARSHPQWFGKSLHDVKTRIRAHHNNANVVWMKEGTFSINCV